MILAFAHPALVVPDLAAAGDFYERMFGFRVIGEEGWHDSPQADRAVGLQGSATRGLMLAGHNCFLELWQYDSPPAETLPLSRAHQPGIRHIAFYVDDCRAEHQRLLSLGGQALGEPTEVAEGIWAVYARDPFGNIVELCEVAKPEEHPLRLPGVASLGQYGVPLKTMES